MNIFIKHHKNIFILTLVWVNILLAAQIFQLHKYNKRINNATPGVVYDMSDRDDIVYTTPSAMPEETPYMQEELLYDWETIRYGKYFAQLYNKYNRRQVNLVFNKDNRIVYYDTSTRTTINQEGKDMLRIWSYGSGRTIDLRFYDLNKGRLSEWQYDSILDYAYGLVAYIDVAKHKPQKDKLKLIIQDIFDGSVFYAEFFRDFTYVDNPYDTAKEFCFIDENSLFIEYYIEEYEGDVFPRLDRETRSEIIYFRDPETGEPLSEGKS